MKVTQRDKILLLVLLVLVVAAIVVVLPEYGILACNEKINNIESESNDLDVELDDTLKELVDLGVNAVHAQNAYVAKNRLEEKIWTMKEEASRLAGSIMAYSRPYEVDSNWVEGLEYRYGVKADAEEKIVEYSPIKDVEGSDDGNDKEINVDGEIVALPTAKREIRFVVTENADCLYQTNNVLDGYEVSEMGAALVFLQHIASKGSMLIDDFYYYTSNAKNATVNFTLLMPPKESGISRYADEIAERNSQQEDNDE